MPVARIRSKKSAKRWGFAPVTSAEGLPLYTQAVTAPSAKAFWSVTAGVFATGLAFSFAAAYCFGGWPFSPLGRAVMHSVHASGQPVSHGDRLITRGATFDSDCDAVAAADIKELFPLS